MNEEVRIWARMWTIIVGIVALLVICINAQCSWVTVESMKAGYCQEQKQGSIETLRVKCK